MRLVVEGCGTDLALDGWHLAAARRQCDTCERETRGEYFADVGGTILWRTPLCAWCAMSSAQQVLRVIEGEAEQRGGAA